jgi:hypothetical protein
MTSQDLIKKFGNISGLNKELKRISSNKCRLNKNKSQKDYDAKLTAYLLYENDLKNAKKVLNPTKKFVTTYSQKDIDLLNYDETVKAIKSIQSKKCICQFMTEDISDNQEYAECLKIEQMLTEHRNELKLKNKDSISKSKLNNIVSTLEETEVSKEQIIEMLKNLS